MAAPGIPLPRLELDTSATFENNGAVTVADGSATTLVQADLVNSGTVEVVSGTLQLGDGGACPWSALAVKAGYTVDSGATLEFGNNYNYRLYSFNPGGSIGGAGAVVFGYGTAATFAAGATYGVTGSTTIVSEDTAGSNIDFTPGSVVNAMGALTITTGELDLRTGSAVSVSSLTMTDGVLTGSDALDVTGSTTWTGGTMEGSGSTIAAGGLVLGGDGNNEMLAARTMVNQRTATFSGDGEFQLRRRRQVHQPGWRQLHPGGRRHRH